MPHDNADNAPAGPTRPAPRGWRWWPWFGGVALVVVITANHLGPCLQRQRLQDAGGPVVAVRAEGGMLAGHNTIGIDEGSDGTGGFLRFATLAEWDFDPKAPSPCPPAVASWSGREAACVGFMYPLEPGTQLRTFCLLRTTQTCCYGPRPQYNQYLLVEMRAPVTFERLRPVLVRGRFFADPQPDQGFIYRLEGTSCTPAGADEPDADPATSARAAGLPLFDFAWLAAAEAAGGKAIPPDLAAVEGKHVVVAGYVLDRHEGPPARVLLGRDWWDGVSQGVRPTLSTALPVSARDASQLPALWKKRGLMTGVLQVERDPQRWPEHGIAGLQDAVLGVPGKAEARLGWYCGPFLAPWHEGLLLAGFAALVLRSRRRAARNAASP